MQTNKKLILIGPMGSGKSTLGCAYAAAHGCEVIDTDGEITRRFGSISGYFEAFGERSFRSVERTTVKRAVNSDAKVIACGGGVVLDKECMNLLRRAGDIVLLTAPPCVLKERIAYSDRPLAQKIESILEERAPLYKRYADYVLDTAQGVNVKKLDALLSSPRRNRYDVVLCDSDNTLLDFTAAMRGAVIGAARSMGVKSSDDDIVRVYSAITDEVWGKLERKEITRETLDGIRFEMFAERIGEDIDSKAMNAVYIAEMQKTRNVLDGALDFLRSLELRGIKRYIITNSFTRIARERLKVLDGFTDGAFISEDVGFDKPDARFFEHVLDRIGKPDKSRVLVFGDSETSDIAGGINAGLDTCLLDVTGQKPTRADYSVKSYAELADIL